MWKKVVDTAIPLTSKIVILMGKQTKKQAKITHRIIVNAYVPKEKPQG